MNTTTSSGTLANTTGACVRCAHIADNTSKHGMA